MEGEAVNIRRLDVEETFLPFLQEALVRFAYLHPRIRIDAGPPLVFYAPDGFDLADAVRDFQFVLFRQKIYTETLPLRSALIHGVMGR